MHTGVQPLARHAAGPQRWQRGRRSPKATPPRRWRSGIVVLSPKACWSLQSPGAYYCSPARPASNQALSVSAAPSIKAHFLENSYPSPGGYTGRPYSSREPSSRTQCPGLPGVTPRAGGVRPLCAGEGPRNVPSECAGVGAPTISTWRMALKRGMLD